MFLLYSHFSVHKGAAGELISVAAGIVVHRGIDDAVISSQACSTMQQTCLLDYRRCSWLCRPSALQLHGCGRPPERKPSDRRSLRHGLSGGNCNPYKWVRRRSLSNLLSTARADVGMLITHLMFFFGWQKSSASAVIRTSDDEKFVQLDLQTADTFTRTYGMWFSSCNTWATFIIYEYSFLETITRK